MPQINVPVVPTFDYVVPSNPFMVKDDRSAGLPPALLYEVPAVGGGHGLVMLAPVIGPIGSQKYSLYPTRRLNQSEPILTP